MSGANTVVKAKGKHGGSEAPPRPTPKSGRAKDGIPGTKTAPRLKQR